VQRLFYKLEESRYWGFIRSGTPQGHTRKEINPTGVGLTVFYKTPIHSFNSII